jgi:hypothetical protein
MRGNEPNKGIWLHLTQDSIRFSRRIDQHLLTRVAILEQVHIVV